MIKDELQYQYTQEWVEKFKKSIAAMDRDEEAKRENFLKWEVGRSALQSHVDKLTGEIAEYERLINCDRSQKIEIVVDNLTELPFALIKARIAAKMSHKELADMLGMEEQRIKECEDKNYQCASFVEMLEVSAALAVEFKTAVMEVDFEEIEAGKKSAERWRKWREEKKKKESQPS